MVESALSHAKILKTTIFMSSRSVKASDVFLAVAAYQQLAEVCDKSDLLPGLGKLEDCACSLRRHGSRNVEQNHAGSSGKRAGAGGGNFEAREGGRGFS